MSLHFVRMIPLPLYSSPVAVPKSTSELGIRSLGTPVFSPSILDTSKSRQLGRLPLLRSPLTSSSRRRSQTVDDGPHLRTQDTTLFDNPEFEHYEEASNIQLFFDLFFVAKSSSFTSAHEINSGHSPYYPVSQLSPIMWLSLFVIRTALLHRILLHFVVYLVPGHLIRCQVRHG